MTFDLAAIDRDLDALASGLDVAALLSRSAGAALAPLAALDAELAALAMNLSVVSPARRPETPPAELASPDATDVSPDTQPPLAGPFSGDALFGEEASTSLHVDMSLAEAVAEPAPPEPIAPLSENALFGDESPFADPSTHDLGGLDFDDPGQRVSVSEDLAAMLEGELDPNEFGPPRSSRVPFDSRLDQVAFEASPSRESLEAEQAEGIDISVDGDDEMFVDDDAMLAAQAESLPDGEPLPNTDTSPSIPPTGSESQPPEGGEKKGFFKKLFGK